MGRVNISVEYRTWRALKGAAWELDTTQLELLARIGQGDKAALEAFRRKYEEAGE